MNHYKNWYSENLVVSIMIDVGDRFAMDWNLIVQIEELTTISITN